MGQNGKGLGVMGRFFYCQAQSTIFQSCQDGATTYWVLTSIMGCREVNVCLV